MPPRLTKIDELSRGLHTHLTPEDECYYLREYTSRGGFQYSGTNQLISNLKKGVDRQGRPEYRYKQDAIVVVSNELRAALNVAWIQRATLVPVPPSRCKADPLYDDRMTQVVGRVGAGLNADLRELIVVRRTMGPAHMTDDRPSIQELINNYQIDERLAVPIPQSIGLFDDVLTVGSHFKAAQFVLSQRFPHVPIVGIFIARRVFATPEPLPFEEV